MAIRNLRFEEDEILRKQSRKVEEINENVITLIDDMIETMYKMGGVGLAAPQVGILKRIIVIDIGDGPIVLINPEVMERTGEQTVTEGCLSIPGVTGEIIRPKTIKVKGLNKEGKEIIIEGKDVLSQALEHEIDHLNGILFIDKVLRIIERKEG